MLRLFTASATALLLTGCSYDYMQHTDRVSYSAGNAVKANLEAETTDPSRRSSRSTRGLGRDGKVTPDETTTAQ